MRNCPGAGPDDPEQRDGGLVGPGRSTGAYQTPGQEDPQKERLPAGQAGEGDGDGAGAGGDSLRGVGGVTNDCGIAQIIDIFKALLTPLIAILAGWIAYQQLITARRQFRLNYFDKRISVYTAAMEFVTGIVSNGTCTKESSRTFLVKIREARFLFENDIEKYLLGLHKKAEQLMINRQLQESGAPNPNSQDNATILIWFIEQMTVIPIKFEKFLKVEN